MILEPIKIQEADPLSNLVEFKVKPREPSLKIEQRRYGACQHQAVFVNEEKRTVRCQKCDVELDAFQVILEFAQRERRWLYDLEAWEARRDSLLSERYDSEWQRHIGDVTEPPKDPELLAAWNIFQSYFKGSLVRMYKRRARKRVGPMWYGVNKNGGCVSLEYARAELIPKLVKPIA